MARKDAKRMNLLVLMTDQQRTDTLGCLGETPCRTPALDRVAAGGVTFANAFTPVPLCSPARASILTGRHAHAHRCIDNCIQPAGGSTTGLPGLDPAETTISERLAGAGYTCAYSGKWHLGRETEPQRGYTRFTSHRDPSYLQGLRARGYQWDELKVYADLEQGAHAPYCGTSPLPAHENRDAFVARNAVSMLEELAARPGPFALWCSFYGPHQPFSVPSPWDSLYRPEDVALPPSLRDDCAGKPAHVRRVRATDKACRMDEAAWRRVRAHYYGYVSFLDAQFASVLGRLADLGLWENTMIVVLSDHGEMLGDHGFHGKNLYFYEGVMRTPLIVRVPGCGVGRVERGLASLVDVAPTVLEALGLPAAAEIQGRSLLPSICGRSPAGRGAVFAGHHGRPGLDGAAGGGRMIRTARHKYCCYTTGEEELYDLAADPHELQNLAGRASQQGLQTRLRGRLRRWMRETGDFFPNVPEELIIPAAPAK